jgi:hypothetical protein
MATWHCGSRDCPTHSERTHRCQVGVWFCGRRQPPCPGHASPDHHCEFGAVWHCGSRDCPTHSARTHRCQSGVWFCGRRQPPCPGHRRPEDRCAEPPRAFVDYRSLLLPRESATFQNKIVNYGASLRANKTTLSQAFAASNIRNERRVLMMVMAMIETNHLSPDERDKTKDTRTDRSANASIFNLNEHMLREVGYQGDIHLLDPLAALPQVVTLIDRAIDKPTWSIRPNPGVSASGVTAMLNFVRGGSAAYRDGVSYDAANYRNAVSTGLRLISSDESLMSDERRIEMKVAHQ